MLPQNRRLPAPLLLPALKKSTVFSSEHLILRVHRLVKEEQEKPARIAIITPAKINKLAVDRHLSKRKISAYLEKDLNLIKSGQYLIWQIKKDITKLDSASLSQEIKSLLTSCLN
ncbi:MAG: ribonuclease P protein component [Candidatus Paceibacterota bacterium]|jgi:ribonuclease P protein component